MNQKLLTLLFIFVTYHIFSQTENLQTNKAPNVIIILVDDLGYEDVGFNGSKYLKTPHIDKIAHQGALFTQAYVTYPVCGPSRAGLITGRYQDRFGFGRNPLHAPNDSNMGLPLTEETLAEVLKKANYKSVAIGKWHLGAHESLSPLARGFDDFFGFLSGGHSYLPELWDSSDAVNKNSQTEPYHSKLLRNNTTVDEKEYLTDALSREAVSYLEKYKNDTFFLYLAYNAPHSPLQATQKYLDRYAHIDDVKTKTYAAMISAVDDGVGSILQKLDELRLTENTIVVFLSDNGGPEQNNGSNNGPLRGGKSELFEGGIRVPFAIKWPMHIPQGTIFKKPVISLDIFATIVSQTKAKTQTKNKLDGVNLIPYLKNIKNEEYPHDFLYWRKFDSNQYAVLNSSGIKLIYKNNQKDVYNLNHNISEEANLNFENNPSVDSLNDTYKTWLLEMINPTFLGLNQAKQYFNKTN